MGCFAAFLAVRSRHGIFYIGYIISENIHLMLSRRQGIFQPRQNLAHRRLESINTLYALNNFVVFVGNNYIAVPAHNLNDDIINHRIAQIIAAIEHKSQYSLKSILPNFFQHTAAQELTQKHSEHRRFFWIFDMSGGKLNTGTIRLCR